MLKTKTIYIALFFILISLQGNLQAVKSIGEKNLKNEEYRLNEQIVLETDREIYMAGEKIQLACLTYEPFLQHILDLSKIVYIEFYTSHNLVIDQIKIEMNNGNGKGYVEIPKRLSSGIYYLRAYTNYMKNYGCTGFAYSSVTILNPFVTDVEDNDRLTSTSLKFMLYPEGGSIIPGTYNNVVCEFTDNSGHTVSGMGRVLDNNDQVISTFTTNAYGLGSFSFIPKFGVEYRVEAIANATILEQFIEIPETAIGLVKKAQKPEYIQFSIQQYQFSEYPVQLVVYHAGSDRILLELYESDSLLKISSSDIPKGIVQFRLQHPDGNILSRRNVLISPQKRSNIVITPGKIACGHRETLELALEETTGNISNPVLSLSVFLIEKDNVLDYLGYNETEFYQSVLYPFLGGSPYPVDEVMQDKSFLEHVLITRTVSDFYRESFKVSAYNELKYLPERCHDLIFGKVFDEIGEPVASAPLIQTWVHTLSTMQTTKTNDDGMFFLMSNRKGVQELIVANSKHTTGNIRLQEEFYPDFFSLAQEEPKINSANRNVFKQQMLNLQINDSYRNNKPIYLNTDSIPFFVEPDKLFFIEDYIPLPTLEEFLFEVVPNMLPYRSKGKTIIRMPFSQSNVLYGDDPLFLVDGIPIFDAERIAHLNCTDLLSVGIIYEKFFFQNETFDGILDIHTREGDASVVKIPENVYAGRFVGIQQANIPVNNKSAIDPRTPYFRTQLYWNPEVILDENLKAHVKITTPDNSGDYLIRCSLKRPDGYIEYFYTTFSVVD